MIVSNSASNSFIKDQEDALLSQADRDFEYAVRALDFPAIEKAMAAGANPNRPFTDHWTEYDGARPMKFLGEAFGRQRLDAAGRIGPFGHSHASAMKALVEAGADFSLPFSVFRHSRWLPFTVAKEDGLSDRGCNLWTSESLPIESCVWFAKGGGSMAKVFGGSRASGCFATGSRTMRRGLAEDVFGPMWDIAIKPMLGDKGSSALLSNALSQGLLEWSEWLIAKGATPAPASSGGSLRPLAMTTILGAHPSLSGHCPWGVNAAETSAGAQRMAREAKACARLAVEFGEDVNAAAEGNPPTLLQLLAHSPKHDIAAALDFAKTLVELGASPLAGHDGKPFLAYALSDPLHAIEQLDFALAVGADPKDRPRQAIFALLNRAYPKQEQAVVLIIKKLAELGADLAQPSSEPAGSSLLAVAAANGLWKVAMELASLGCDIRWKDIATGETLMSLATGWSAIHGRSGCAQAFAAWLASAGAPVDDAGHGGLTALHRAAKALDHKLCEALLTAGADANRAVADPAASTPSHLACSRFDRKKEAAQLATLEALSLHGADFSKVDGKGRSAMEVASKNASLSVVMAVLQKANGSAFAGAPGARASKVLGSRGSDFLAVVESSELQSATANSASAASPNRKRLSL